MIRPPRITEGARVSVIAPAGPVPEAAFAAGAQILRGRYTLVHDGRIFERRGYLAGDDAARRAELERALLDPTTQAVICARGGYGTTRLFPLPAIHKLVVGFSDITVLHAAAAAAQVASIHGPVVTQLGNLPAEDQAALFALLESPAAPPPLLGLSRVAPGAAQGTLRGGNLELLSRLCGTALQPRFCGCALLIEDVGERPYRIDRALTQLYHSGALEGLLAVVVGDFIRCVEPDGTGPTALEVIAERFAALGVPIVAGAPIGHGARNRAVPLGARVNVDANRGEVEFLDGAVS